MMLCRYFDSMRTYRRCGFRFLDSRSCFVFVFILLFIHVCCSVQHLSGGQIPDYTQVHTLNIVGHSKNTLKYSWQVHLCYRASPAARRCRSTTRYKRMWSNLASTGLASWAVALQARCFGDVIMVLNVLNRGLSEITQPMQHITACQAHASPHNIIPRVQ